MCKYLVMSMIFLTLASNILNARISSEWVPRVSIITSLYDADEFVEGFLYDITQQTIFDQCELIIINANSPGNEEPIIKQYMERYPNIIYKRLPTDPGLYAVWNMAIKMARGAYITNANVDDRLRFDCYEIHAMVLKGNQKVDLVYSNFYVTDYPNETFEINRHHKTAKMPSFSQRNMRKTLPNNHPMWRKTMHKKYGYFDTCYRFAGDWEFWLRAVKQGAQFLKIPGVYGLFYINPRGLSNEKTNTEAVRERKKIYEQYKDLFKQEVLAESIKTKVDVLV